MEIIIVQTPPFWLKTPPLSLIYLKNYLLSKNIKVTTIDLNFIFFKLLKFTKTQWLNLDREFEKNLFLIAKKNFPFIFENFYKKIKNIEFIGFSILKRNMPFALKLANEIKMLYPTKKIIFGGPQTLFLDLQNKLIDDYFWVIGEGENPLYKILTESNQKIYKFNEIKELDTLPFLNFQPLLPQNYSMSIPLFSSRGCLYNCHFCSEKLLYKKMRYHSPKYVVDLIKHLKNEYSIPNFIFCDSLFNFSREWLENFCLLLLKNNIKINWEAQMRIEKNFPLYLAKLIKKSGCYNVFVGMESGSNKVLSLMDKGFTTEDAINFFKIFKKAGLHFEISLIFGYPNETEKDFMESIEFIVKNKKIIPKIAQANLFVDYFNTQDIANPPKNLKNRLEIFLKTIQSEKIKYTKSYIGNLHYKN
ncbi:MAG: B12-binding domain-containing radical SAM protein [Candidatus Omnitrophica bacterium]|nr:B12-binding domain-containing radical SAM protein [Candidatus Omnitrophota bacterium]